MRRAAVMLIAALLAFPAVPPLAAGAQGRLVPLAGAVPAFVAGAIDVGPADPTAPLELLLALHHRDEPGLRAIADEPGARRLSHAEVVARFGVDQATTAAVARFGLEAGMTLGAISDDGALVAFNTTVATASDAFHVALRMYRSGDITIRSIGSPPMVPAEIAPAIEAIVGLTDARAEVEHARIADDPMTPADGGAAPWGALDIRNAYDVNAALVNGYDGTGHTVALTSWGSSSQAMLNDYSSNYGIPTATIAHETSSGGSSCPATDASTNVEWDLDAQMLHATAPGAAIRVYCGSTASVSALMSAIDRAISDNVADVISNSWGVCEASMDSGTASAIESQFTTASAQGQAFFFASGDGGSRECTRTSPGDSTIAPSWPATAPHTTSVGGTTLTMSGSSYASETTWATCIPCSTYDGSGGGPSHLYAKPSWQTAPSGATARGSADVSSVAYDIRVRTGGSWAEVEGTSASSPSVAGMWEDLVSRHGRMGNAAQRLWPLLGANADLRDITTGSNGDFSAGAGYDYPTGLGSPRIGGLLTALATLAPPTALHATGGDGSMTLTWAGSPDAVTGYKIYRGSADAPTLVATIGNVTSYVDTGLANGTSYTYRVSAIDSTRESAWTLPATGRTFGAPTAPRLLTAAPQSGFVSLAWTPPLLDGGAAASYRVYGADTNATFSATRLIGGERFAYALDARDADVPSAGMTRDATGARNGTLRATTASDGVFTDALQLHGLVSYLSVPESSVGLAQGTLMMWIRPDDLGPDGATERLYYKQYPGSYNAFMLRLDGTGANEVLFQLAQSDPVLGGATSIPLHEWTHVAVTWGPSGQRIYVNGALDGSNANTHGLSSLYSLTMVGNSPNDISTGGFDGAMDEVREYATQLSPAQVQDIMRAPYVGAATSFSLVGTPGAPAFQDSTILVNRPRTWLVSAVNAYGESGLSAPVTSLVTQQAPDAPVLASVRSTGRGELTLDWSAPTAPTGAITGYRVSRGSALWNIAPVADVGLVTSFVDAGLPDARAESYQVQALYGATPGNASLVVANSTWSTPRTAPTSVAATRGPGVGQVSLAWAAPTDDGGTSVTGYRIERQQGASFVSVGTSATTSFVESGLPMNASETYRVRATNLVGDGVASASASATTFAPPGAEQGLAAARGAADDAITLTWSAPSFDDGWPVSSYNVYDATTGSDVAVGSTSSTSFVRAGLAPNTTYSFRVAAVSAVGEGAHGVTASALTFGKPWAPIVTVASGPGVGQVMLNWSAPFNSGRSIARYHVYVGNASGNETIATNATAPNVTLNGLPSGALRFFQVSAENSVGEGPRSVERLGRAYAVPNPPTNLATSVPVGTTATVVHLTWSQPSNTAIAGVQGYKLFRGGELYDIIAGAGATVYNDRFCPVGTSCSYAVSAIGAIGESGLSNGASGTGLSAGLAIPGAPSTDPADRARLIGHERLVLQMDADDTDQPGNGFTRDSSAFGEPYLRGPAAPAPGRFGGGYAIASDAGIFQGLAPAQASELTEGTIMMWVNATQGGVLAREDGVSTQLLLRANADGSLSLQVGSIAGLSGVLTTRAGALPFGRFAHVAAQWGPTGLRVFVDGALAGSLLDTTPVGAGALAMSLGTAGFRGTLDEARVYDAAIPVGMIDSIANEPYEKSAV